MVEAVLEETEGNPFFMTEVVSWLQSDGRLKEGSADDVWTIRIPESVREAIGNRLDRLSPETNEILTIAAVIGREFQLQLLARAADIEPLELLDWLEEAVQAGVLDELEQPGNYRFSHALIQETLYSELTTGRRLRLQRRSARHWKHCTPMTLRLTSVRLHFTTPNQPSPATLTRLLTTPPGPGIKRWSSQPGTLSRALQQDKRSFKNQTCRIETILAATMIDQLLAYSDAHWSSGNSKPGPLHSNAANVARRLSDPTR